MEIVANPGEKPSTAPTGTPVHVSEQPAAPSFGADKTEGKSKATVANVNAAKAKIMAKGSAPAVTSPPAATPAAAAAVAVPVETAKPGELTDAAIDAAATKAAALAEDKAAVVAPAEDFAAKVKLAEEATKKGDTLAALKVLGIDLDAAVRQAGAAPAVTTEEQRLKDENKRLAEENAQIKRDNEARNATAQAEANYHATVNAIVADAKFPKITTAAQVAEALAPAKAAHAVLVADLGRPLNDTEKDRLVQRYLKRYNDGVMSSEQPPVTAAHEPSVKAGTVVPARTKRPSVAEVKADILAGKRKPH